MISQFFGAKKEDMVNRSLHCAYAFAIFGGAVISVIGIILTPSFLGWMKTSPDVIADSTVYLRIYFSGIIFVFIYNMGSSILRSTGDSKRPLYYLIICCFINIFLDILLVVVFRLAVAGVAIATWISQAVSAILVTRCLMRSENGLKLTLSKIRIAPDILKGQLKIGLPGGFQSCMYNISNVLIQACINRFRYGYGRCRYGLYENGQYLLDDQRRFWYFDHNLCRPKLRSKETGSCAQKCTDLFCNKLPDCAFDFCAYACFLCSASSYFYFGCGSYRYWPADGSRGFAVLYYFRYD